MLIDIYADAYILILPLLANFGIESSIVLN